jgi:phosphatidate cytidylyltransferase
LLRYRLAGAFCLIVPVVALLWLDDQRNFGYPGIWLAPLAALVAIASATEMIGLLRKHSPSLTARPAVVATLLFSAIAVVPLFRDTADCALGVWGWAMLATLAALALLLVGEILRYEEAEGISARVACGFLATVYVALPMCFFLYLRSQVAGRLGLLAIVSVIFVVKSSDAGAYFSGRSFGRHKLAPKISPGKTIEGAIGGTLTAVLAAWMFHSWIIPALVPNANDVPIGVLTLYGVALALVGMLGDLSISMFKRDASEKDSAAWLPGLGGVLDIIDSLVWAIPLAYLFWASGWLR